MFPEQDPTHKTKEVIIHPSTMSDSRRQKLEFSGDKRLTFKTNSKRYDYETTTTVASDLYGYHESFDVKTGSLYRLGYFLVGSPELPNMEFDLYEKSVTAIDFYGHICSIPTAFDIIRKLKACEIVRFFLGQPEQLPFIKSAYTSSSPKAQRANPCTIDHVKQLIINIGHLPSAEENDVLRDVIKTQLEQVVENAATLFPNLANLVTDLPGEGCCFDLLKQNLGRWKKLVDQECRAEINCAEQKVRIVKPKGGKKSRPQDVQKPIQQKPPAPVPQPPRTPPVQVQAQPEVLQNQNNQKRKSVDHSDDDCHSDHNNAKKQHLIHDPPNPKKYLPNYFEPLPYPKVDQIHPNPFIQEEIIQQQRQCMTTPEMKVQPTQYLAQHQRQQYRRNNGPVVSHNMNMNRNKMYAHKHEFNHNQNPRRGRNNYRVYNRANNGANNYSPPKPVPPPSPRHFQGNQSRVTNNSERISPQAPVPSPSLSNVSSSSLLSSVSPTPLETDDDSNLYRPDQPLTDGDWEDSDEDEGQIVPPGVFNEMFERRLRSPPSQLPMQIMQMPKQEVQEVVEDIVADMPDSQMLILANALTLAKKGRC